MPRFTGYPANWDLMSAMEKVEWVKAAFPGVPDRTAAVVEATSKAAAPINSNALTLSDSMKKIMSDYPSIANRADAMKEFPEVIKKGLTPGAKDMVKDTYHVVTSGVPKIHGQTASEIYAQSLLDKQKAAQNASAGAAGVGAGLKGLAGLKVGAAASFGAPLAAGALGALAIRHTKKKFDKEVDAGVRDTMKRGDELIAAARRSRKNKISK